VTNITLEDHLLYPGAVFRQVVQQRDDIRVDTLGLGNGSLGPMNAALGALLWSFQTRTIRANVRELPR
jgi:hypothetical protein